MCIWRSVHAHLFPTRLTKLTGMPVQVPCLQTATPALTIVHFPVPPSLHGGALRSSLLVALAAASGDELRRSVLLLRRQHLQYTGDMMGAVLGMLMQQRARVELIEVGADG